MNNEGLNESSGIGTGLAQVFKPYTPQYNQGEIGMVEYKMNAAKQEAAAKKQAKLDKLTANIKTPLMPAKYIKGYKELADKVVEYRKLHDEEGVLKTLADLGAYGAVAKAAYEVDKSTNATVLSQGLDKFEGYDEFHKALHDDKTPVNINNVFDVYNSDMNYAHGVKKKAEPFDYIKNVNAAQNAVNPIQEGRRIFISPAAAKDAAQHFIEKDPEFNKFYQDQFKQLDPALQKQYGDYVSFGIADLSPQLVLDKTSPEPKDTNVNVSMGGGDEGKDFSEVAPVNLQAANDKTISGVGITHNVQQGKIVLPVETTDLSGNPIKASGLHDVQFGQTVVAPTTTIDINLVGKDGKSYKLPAGSYVSKEIMGYLRNNSDNPDLQGVLEMKPYAIGTANGDGKHTFDVMIPQNVIENQVSSSHGKWAYEHHLTTNKAIKDEIDNYINSNDKNVPLFKGGTKSTTKPTATTKSNGVTTPAALQGVKGR